MRMQSIIVLLTLFAVSYVHGAEQGKHLFILSGQSNMQRLNPDISFIPGVEAAFGKENVIIVKDAEGGQPILRWYKKWNASKAYRIGDLYDRLMAKVNEAIKDKQLASITLVWMQGESDATNNASVYAASLKGLLDQFRTDLGRKELHVVIGRISDYRTDTDWELVRKAQVEVAEADPHAAWVDTDDLNGGKKDLHYSPAGYKRLGQRFADSAIQLINQKPNKQDASVDK